MSTGRKIMFAIPVLTVALTLGLFLYAKIENIDRTDPANTTDPLLKQLQLLNPQLRIEDEFSRLPVFWILEPGSGRKLLFPRSEAAGAKIRLGPCDMPAIPQHLIYPKSTDISCLEIDNDSHKLMAFHFRTKDDIKKVVDFYEAPLDASRRFSVRRDNYKERREEDQSRAFLFSYFLNQVVDLEGFTGYREVRK